MNRTVTSDSCWTSTRQSGRSFADQNDTSCGLMVTAAWQRKRCDAGNMRFVEHIYLAVRLAGEKPWLSTALYCVLKNNATRATASVIPLTVTTHGTFGILWNLCSSLLPQRLRLLRMCWPTSIATRWSQYAMTQLVWRILTSSMQQVAAFPGWLQSLLPTSAVFWVAVLASSAV